VRPRSWTELPSAHVILVPQLGSSAEAAEADGRFSLSDASSRVAAMSLENTARQFALN
jgi:hypothetical protein